MLYHQPSSLLYWRLLPGAGGIGGSPVSPAVQPPTPLMADWGCCGGLLVRGIPDPTPPRSPESGGGHALRRDARRLGASTWALLLAVLSQPGHALSPPHLIPALHVTRGQVLVPLTEVQLGFPGVRFHSVPPHGPDPLSLRPPPPPPRPQVQPSRPPVVLIFHPGTSGGTGGWGLDLGIIRQGHPSTPHPSRG